MRRFPFVFTGRVLIVIAAVVVVAAPFILWKLLSEQTAPAPKPEMAKIGGVSLHARVGERYLQTYRDGEWRDILTKGVNMGISKPGYFPGETAIGKQEYLRWFQQIGEMNANTVRVYTLHPPAFYEALLEYNETAKQPLYLLHGVWLNEEELVKSGDALADGNSEQFKREIERTIDVVHGKADIPVRPGHASGRYTADVSPYLLGWVLGIEWDPVMVVSTNAKHAGKPDYDGTYFRTQGAQPFESWLAEMMDDAAVYETDRYSRQRPMSFTNWVTTDPLRHPSEPSENEDMVSVDPNVVYAKDGWYAGYFASYHVYPYYPDFMNYDPKLAGYVDWRGQNNTYAGYLHDLRQAHRMPVLVAEFGVPASRGMTHRSASGWNQGFLSEKEQGEIDVRLFEDIVKEGMAGGLVFTWQDEWFKRTWNTMDYDNPDRRPFWSNAQTNEQQFGLLSFDPGTAGQGIRIDGDDSDWTKAGIAPVFKAADGLVQRFDDGYDDGRKIEQVFVASDERYVYFRIDLGHSEQSVDWKRMNMAIMIDTVPDQGQHKIPQTDDVTAQAGIDFIIDLKGPEKSRITVDSYYDPFYYHYGHLLRMIPQLPYPSVRDNGVFHPIRLTLNKELRIPDANGSVKIVPFDAYETGLLRFGNGNPDAADYDSLSDVSVDGEGRRIELRIPWMLLNMKDPSTHEAIGDFWKQGLTGSATVPSLRFAVMTYLPGEGPSGAGGRAADMYPRPVNGVLPADGMAVYRWNGWEQPTYHERLKQSYGMLKAAFGSIQPGEE